MTCHSPVSINPSPDTPTAFAQPPFCLARIAAFGLLVLATACGGAPQARTVSGASQAALVLPASTQSSPEAAYCAKKGGKVRPEPAPGGGVRAMCFLPDQRIAEIGALYRVEVVDRL